MTAQTGGPACGFTRSAFPPSLPPPPPPDSPDPPAAPPPPPPTSPLPSPPPTPLEPMWSVLPGAFVCGADEAHRSPVFLTHCMQINANEDRLSTYELKSDYSDGGQGALELLTKGLCMVVPCGNLDASDGCGGPIMVFSWNDPTNALRCSGGTTQSHTGFLGRTSYADHCLCTPGT